MEKCNQKLSEIDYFETLPLGTIVGLNINLISPSQPNDYRSSVTDGPINVCCDKGKILIIDGNHRYWEEYDRSKDGESRLLLVKKTENPHEIY